MRITLLCGCEAKGRDRRQTELIAHFASTICFGDLPSFAIGLMLKKPQSGISHTERSHFLLQPSLFIRSSISDDDKISGRIVNLKNRSYDGSQSETFS